MCPFMMELRRGKTILPTPLPLLRGVVFVPFSILWDDPFCRHLPKPKSFITPVSAQGDQRRPGIHPLVHSIASSLPFPPNYSPHMTLLTFFGCALTAYGPSLAIFFGHIAPNAQLVILMVSRYPSAWLLFGPPIKYTSTDH